MLIVVFPVCDVGFVKDEAAPQVTLHPGGSATIASSGPGRSRGPHSHRASLFFVCQPGNYSNGATRARDAVHSLITAHVSSRGAGLSPADGNPDLQLPSHFLGSTIVTASSVCFRAPTGQRHEAFKSLGKLWQTRLCQTGKL